MVSAWGGGMHGMPTAMHTPFHACPLPRMPPATHAPCHACPLPCTPPAMHAPLPHMHASPAMHAPPVDRQTRVKTIPSQTSFAGGKK